MAKFKPRDRLNHTQELINLENKTEAWSRTTIHQAYYSAFNQVCEEIDNRLFFKVDPTERLKSVHQSMINACINKASQLHDSRQKNNRAALDKTVKALKTLRAYRRRADYELSRAMTYEDAKISLGLANTVFDELDKYC
jgi:histidyl-tRNA synthetase